MLPQLAEQSLPTSEHRGSKPAITKFYKEQLLTVYFPNCATETPFWFLVLFVYSLSKGYIFVSAPVDVVNKFQHRILQSTHTYSTNTF